MQGEGMNITESMERESSISNLLIEINDTHSPTTWMKTILKHARDGPDNIIGQHLVGAKLQKRHEHCAIPNHPAHAADVQTDRPGDYTIHNVVYHVTASPSQAVMQKCEANIRTGKRPVLLVPQDKKAAAEAFADLAHIDNQIDVISIEDFVAVNIIEMSVGAKTDFFQILKEIIEIYNKRLSEVETDMSLRIEIR